MPRTDVTTQQIVKEGLAPALTAPIIDGDVIDTGRVFLWVDNTDVAAKTVTVVSPVEVDGLAVEDLAVVVPAGGAQLLGPFTKTTFGQPAGSVDAGRAYVDYSPDVTGVTRGVFTL